MTYKEAIKVLDGLQISHRGDGKSLKTLTVLTAVLMAMQAMDKQIEKFVIEEEEDGVQYDYCPCCCTKLGVHGERPMGVRILNLNIEHCNVCGQKLVGVIR